MHHPDWIAEFHQKLLPAEGDFLAKKNGEETSPQVKRWLRLADQMLSTGNLYDDAT